VASSNGAAAHDGVWPTLRLAGRRVSAGAPWTTRAVGFPVLRRCGAAGAPRYPVAGDEHARAGRMMRQSGNRTL